MLEYLHKTEEGSKDAFFSFKTPKETIKIYIKRKQNEENPKETILHIFSNNSFCNTIKNNFSVKGNTVESFGRLTRQIYNTINDKITQTIENERFF